MKSKAIFLTVEQALAAVCLDLRQYEPQIPLMRELLRLISVDADSVIQVDINSSVWVLCKGHHRLQKITAVELATSVCTQLAKTKITLDVWAAICRRVFQSQVTKARDPDSGQWGLWVETGMQDFACHQCGQCCHRLDYHQELTQKDIRRWRDTGRDDILVWVAETKRLGGGNLYQIWVIPGTNRFAESCPFLKQGKSNHLWICGIHDTKPQICRQYPITRKHALMTGCKGFSD